MTGQQKVQEELVINYWRPSKLVPLLGPLAKDYVVKVDDPRSRIVVAGSKEDLSHIRSLISLFDVKPIPIDIAIRIASKLDHSTFNSQFTISNRQELKVHDGSSSVELSLAARANDDGTVTLSIMTTQGKPQTAVVRLRRTDSFLMDLSGKHLSTDSARVRKVLPTLDDSTPIIQIEAKLRQ